MRCKPGPGEVSAKDNKPKWPLVVAGIAFALFGILMLLMLSAFRHLAG